MPAREPIVELGDFSRPGTEATPWPVGFAFGKGKGKGYSQTRYRFAGRS
jgi:hypothetical protein